MIDGYSKNDEGSIMYTFKSISKGFIRQGPFCTGLSSGNQVDGLPLAVSTGAVAASYRKNGSATIGNFQTKNIIRIFEIILCRSKFLKFYF